MFNFIFPIFHIHVHIRILALLLLTPTGSSRRHSTYLSFILVTHHGGLIAGFILFLPTPTVHGHHARFLFMHVLLLQLKFVVVVVAGVVVVVVVVGDVMMLMDLGYFNIHQLLWDWL